MKKKVIGSALIAVLLVLSMALCSRAAETIFQRTREVMAMLKTAKIKYEVLRSDKEMNVLLASVRGKNMSKVDIQIFVDPNVPHWLIYRVFNIVRVPKTKINTILSTVNYLNYKYKFCKFVFEDDSIRADYDLEAKKIDSDCSQALMNLIMICDDTYPKLMKAVYN